MGIDEVEKKVIFYRMSRVLFGFTSIFYQRTSPQRSPPLSLHTAKQTFARNVSTYFILHPLPPSNRREPQHLFAGQFTRLTIFAVRIVSHDPRSSCSFFEGFFEKRGEEGGENKKEEINNYESLKEFYTA